MQEVSGSIPLGSTIPDRLREIWSTPDTVPTCIKSHSNLEVARP